jgi:pyruvyl transferase EpsO
MKALSAGATPPPHLALVTALRERIIGTLRPLLGRARSVALIGYPNHANVGDSAIWLGTLAYLRLDGFTITYTCDVDSYSKATLARRLDGGAILISGGGDLGDVWEAPQALRERVISDFPNTPIIQLPQSIYFQDLRALSRARQIFDAHKGLTLLLRDRQSVSYANREFSTPCHLCPDMAFCLGPNEHPGVATRGILWLSQPSQETMHSVPVATDIERVDWATESVSAVGLTVRLDRALMRRTRVLHAFDRTRSLAWERLARQRFDRGCGLLASARSVVTDRLHGHILSVLLGIPHLLLDSRTGKVRGFYDTWTHSLPLARWCESPAEALALARSGAWATTATELFSSEGRTSA